jgi:hypothetical protein
MYFISLSLFRTDTVNADVSFRKTMQNLETSYISYSHFEIAPCFYKYQEVDGRIHDR